MAFRLLYDRVARGFGGLRGVMLIIISVVLLSAPEQAVHGSTNESARALALMVASRTIMLGLALVVLAVRANRTALAWVLFADAAFQVFDAGLAVTLNKGPVAALPAVIGVLDAWMGVTLLRLHAARAQSA